VDVNRASAWANIGSFLLGCGMLYLMVHQQPPVEGTGTGPAAQSPLNPMMWIFLTGLIIAGVLHIAAAAMTTRLKEPPASVPLSSNNPVAQASPLPTGDRETVNYLVGLFKLHTAIQAQKLIEPHLGQKLRLSGTLTEVQLLGSKSVIAIFGPDLPEPMISMVFDEAWANRLSILRRGDHVTVIGKIASVESGRLSLQDCELVNS
jgi:hypothetical protein